MFLSHNVHKYAIYLSWENRILKVIVHIFSKTHLSTEHCQWKNTKSKQHMLVFLFCAKVVLKCSAFNFPKDVIVSDPFLYALHNNSSGVRLLQLLQLQMNDDRHHYLFTSFVSTVPPQYNVLTSCMLTKLLTKKRPALCQDCQFFALLSIPSFVRAV